MIKETNTKERDDMDGIVLTLQYAYLRLIDAQEGRLSRRDEPLV